MSKLKLVHVEPVTFWKMQSSSRMFNDVTSHALPFCRLMGLVPVGEMKLKTLPTGRLPLAPATIT